MQRRRVGTRGRGLGVELSRIWTMHALAVAAIVCGAWFDGLPAGWHQSAPSATQLTHGATRMNTFSWAANFRPSPRFGLSRNFPRGGVYVWVALDRSTHRARGGP